MDQNGSNLINLDFWWNNHWNISSDFQLCLFLARVLAKALKMLFSPFANTSSQFFHFSTFSNFWWKNHWNISSDFQHLFIFWLKWIRSVQNGSNSIKLDFRWNNHSNISSDFQLYLFFDQIESDLSKMDQNG